LLACWLAIHDFDGNPGLWNPITLEERETETHLSNRLIWKIGQAAKSKLMRVSSPRFNFDN
jgi:hypothetical protein